MPKASFIKNSAHEKEQTIWHRKAVNIIAIAMCILLLPMLIANITLIIRGYTEPDKAPSFAGVTPMIVLTDSMYPYIHSGDLILCKTVEPETVAEGDVISFFDPAGSGTSIVTHRVLEVTTEDGSLAYRTKGDANNTEDPNLVPAENLVGIYQHRIPKLGSVAMFIQSPAGLVVSVVLPFILLIGYDLTRRRIYEKKQQVNTDALMEELQALRAEKKAQMNTEASR